MKKILYLMHIPWGWIKQRPHFFAEYLSKDYDIDIVYKRPLKVKKDHLVNKNSSKLKIRGFQQLPFYKISFLSNSFICKQINKLIFSISITKKNFEKYDYVWITSVSLYSIIKPLISSKTKIIWDCMDDELEFGNVKYNRHLLKKMKVAESEFIRRANIIFCSSDYLSNKIQVRADFSRNIFIVNNAIQLPTNEEQVAPNDKVIKDLSFLESFPNIFMYIGTISEWFNFDIIINALNKNSDMHIVLIGPNDVPIRQHERIIYLGTIERIWIFHYMEKAKALIMPFTVNELIKSVNPVKLYEYIFAYKPILIPFYKEVEKFGDYVYFYKSEEDFLNMVEKIISDEIKCRKSELEYKNFANNNQWENRCQQIKKYII